MSTPVDVAWQIDQGQGPLVAVALHAGHRVDPRIEPLMRADEITRLREEDPYTDRWTPVGDHQVVVHTSRFQIDMNRPHELAIYAGPEQAWGIDVWREPLPDDLRAGILAHHGRFYGQVETLLDELVERHGRIVVFDLHSYCHRRNGPDAPVDDPALNPDINLCTKTLDLSNWGPLVDAVENAMRAHGAGRFSLDVRRDVKFTGGRFVRWVNDHYGPRACGLQVEVKKTFMDEWTGALDQERHAAIGGAIEGAAGATRGWLDAS